MTETVQYACCLICGTAMMIAGAADRDWLLKGSGLGLILLAIVAVNLSAYMESSRTSESEPE